MRFLVVCAFALGSYAVSAASAYWTGLIVGNGGYSGDSSQVAGYSIQGTVYSGDGAYATINATMEGYVVEGSYFLKSLDYTRTGEGGIGVVAPVENVWVLAFCGDVLNAETIRAATQIAPIYSYGEASGGTPIADRRDFYLAFEASEYGVEDGRSWYGWAHVSVDDDLRMTLLGSGIGLNGESVIAGAVPEPSGGLLLLLGTAVLALRRRRPVKDRGGVECSGRAATCCGLGGRAGARTGCTGPVPVRIR